MERRLVLFVVFSVAILLGYYAIFPPPRPRQQKGQVAAKDAAKGTAKDTAEKPKPPPGNEKERSKASEKAAAEKPAAKADKAGPAIQAAPEPAAPEQWVTLGSADEADPYRMLVTLTSKGAAVARIELSSPRYCDIDDRSGYLGHLVMDSALHADGCLVQVVGPGTPAAEAGLKPGDVIKTVNGKAVIDQASLDAALERTKPKQTAQLVIRRGGKEQTLSAKLRRRPLEVIKPEGDDPLSMLLSLDRVDDLKLATQWAQDLAIYRLYADLKLGDQDIANLDLADVKLGKDEAKIRLPGEEGREKQWVPLSDEVLKAIEAWQTQRGEKAGPLFSPLPLGAAKDRLATREVHRIIARTRTEVEGQSPAGSGVELEGVDLRRSTWKLVSSKPDEAVFRRTVPRWGLEITKTYRLVRVPGESLANADYPAYHLEFEIEVRNVGDKAHAVAYRLDGPNGLPTEGKWYASKVSRNWGGAGLRDFIISFGGGTPGMVGATKVGGTKPLDEHWPDNPAAPLTFIGVDAQYFSAVLMPQRDNPADVWFDELLPIRVGKADPNHTNLTNTSCRLIGKTQELKPGGALVNRFKLFAGPKKAALLANSEYRLGELIYFGWPIFEWVAVPLTVILHAFFAVTHNYGLAIILLTILVRGCMFPLSLKQAAGAQKMQLLQPEIKKLQEKHKGNVEARTKAQQELFRKHNYNPLSGCLPIFIQMPVFIGLYRSLMVAIELRDAPLISNSIRWCSNLAAPDMLYDWRWFMPAFVNNGQGMFGLGPYFNLLPILTIVLFIWQQKMFMPPPADEQAAMQQKMMKYMMVFMGLLFFKVASGLCIYFIASSLWGLAERRFLPKTPPAAGVAAGSRDPRTSSPGGMAGETRAEAKARARQAADAATAKKNRTKRWWGG